MTPLNVYFDTVKLLAPSLLTAGAVAAAAGVTGVFVLLRREALLALAVPQAVGVGAAIGMRYGWPTLPPALGAATGALGLLAWARHRRIGHLLLPAVYIGALCMAFLLIANSGQHVADLQNMFTGMDVAVSPAEADVAVPILLAIALFVAALWRRWLLLAQSPPIAQLAGLHPARWDAFFLALMAVVVLLGTNALGTVLVLVMLFLPAGIVLPWTRRVPVAMFAAVAVALVILAMGFVASIEMAWPMSQSIGGVGFALFCVANVAAILARV